MAAQRCATSRMLCAGQVCIAAKRIIAVDGIYERFRDLLFAELTPYVMRNPAEADCHLGPLAREDLRNTVHEQVNACVAAGADLVRGGTLPARDGWWYPATVLENVQPGMPASQDEIFGPVAALVRAEDTNHAVALASDTRFGLVAAIFSADREKAAQIAVDEIDAGCVAVNDFVRSDPRVPFGGTKGSGFGRELGRAGIHEFVNLKSVVVAKK